MTRKETKDKRVSDILDAAITEFVDKGYESASMESIAARAGITKGGVYYHFKGKDDILIKANERFMEPIISFMADARSLPSPADGLARYIRNYLEYWTGHHRELIFIFLTLTKTMAEPGLWRLYSGYTAHCTGFFEELYRSGVQAGEFREFDYGAVSLALMAALDGITAYIVMDDTLSPDRAIDCYEEAFIHTYRKGHP
ncbi:MAG: TetR/AcrR family transcriptional regulator [Spirochaetes bacterium]|nr:MAG: TetR/AcrR family transcriptional regulator [Spirochaetota bacterium]